MVKQGAGLLGEAGQLASSIWADPQGPSGHLFLEIRAENTRARVFSGPDQAMGPGPRWGHHAVIWGGGITLHPIFFGAAVFQR